MNISDLKGAEETKQRRAGKLGKLFLWMRNTLQITRGFQEFKQKYKQGRDFSEFARYRERNLHFVPIFMQSVCVYLCLYV